METPFGIGAKFDGRTQAVQIILAGLGYSVGVIDDWYGQATKNAVKTYQIHKGLEATGIVNEKTLKALQSEKPFNVEVTDYTLNAGEFFAQITEKENIFLHLTAGGANGYFPIQGWENDQMQGKFPVATSYVICREHNSVRGWETKDGQILRAFDDRFWALHTGAGQNIDMKSVGIEICNFAFLDLKGGEFFAWTGEKIPKNDVWTLKIPFRQKTFWQKITPKQIQNLKNLLKALLIKYPKIKERFLKQTLDNTWGDYKQSVVNGTEKGIVTHTNVVPESLSLRFDMPAFPELMFMLKTLQNEFKNETI
jgi:hypothetical protein